MDEQEKNDQEPTGDTSEDRAINDVAPQEERDAAKLSDEEATAAARAFLGTAEPVEEVSVDEA